MHGERSVAKSTLRRSVTLRNDLQTAAEQGRVQSQVLISSTWKALAISHLLIKKGRAIYGAPLGF